MNIKITGRSIEVTDAMKDYIEKRLERLEKFEGKNTDVNVVCSVEREDQIAEIQINHDGEFLRVEERNADFYAAIDLALDRAERQLRKEKEKRIEKSQGGAEKVRINDIFSAENNEAAKGEITKTLVYEIKPMSTEDAKLKLESTDDMFLTFVNSKTNEVNVIYKRGDGTFGMVIPE